MFLVPAPIRCRAFVSFFFYHAYFSYAYIIHLGWASFGGWNGVKTSLLLRTQYMLYTWGGVGSGGGLGMFGVIITFLLLHTQYTFPMPMSYTWSVGWGNNVLALAYLLYAISIVFLIQLPGTSIAFLIQLPAMLRYQVVDATSQELL